MVKRFKWYVYLSAALVLFSLISYLIQIEIFHRTEDTFFYMLQDIAFVPIQVLLVTLILNQLLSVREKRSLLKKLNMLIGAFYIEVGTALIKYCSEYCPDLSFIRGKLVVTAKWTDKDFSVATKYLKSSDLRIDSSLGDLEELKSFLEKKRSFLLSLLANPNLLEHDEFTDLLWAVFHLAEELSARGELEGLPKTDSDHLAGDLKRAYNRLLVEWLSYMKHLKKDYPYLFSLAIRTNPLDTGASPIVT